MKLLADMICHAAPTARFKQIRDIADRLRKPALNHVPGDFATPSLERIVFGREESLSMQDMASASSRNEFHPSLLMPMQEFWIEAETPWGRWGYLVEHCEESNGSNVSAIYCVRERGREKIVPFVRFFVSECGRTEHSAVDRLIPQMMSDRREVEYARQAIFFFEAGITALTRTRMASTRRTHRYEGFPNIGVATRRAAQRGAPVYSFNIVNFAFPQVSIQRGETVQSVGDGVRGHWVIGHWRYVDKNTVEPHFTWVPAHKRGNEALGFITKQRNFNTTKHAARGLPPGAKGALGVAV